MIFLVSCSRPLPAALDECPKNLFGNWDAGDSNASWGNPPKVWATITDVSVECVPVPTSTERPSAYSYYEIAATAKIRYGIDDLVFFRDLARNKDLEGTAIFEAVSASGVVLGSAQGSIRIIEGGDAVRGVLRCQTDPPRSCSEDRVCSSQVATRTLTSDLASIEEHTSHAIRN